MDDTFSCRGYWAIKRGRIAPAVYDVVIFASGHKIAVVCFMETAQIRGAVFWHGSGLANYGQYSPAIQDFAREYACTNTGWALIV